MLGAKATSPTRRTTDSSRWYRSASARPPVSKRWHGPTRSLPPMWWRSATCPTTSRCFGGPASVWRWAMPIRRRSRLLTRSRRRTPTTAWPGCWSAGGSRSARVDRFDPLGLHGRSVSRRRWQLFGYAVDDPCHRAVFAIEVQRAVLEVLHDPLWFLNFAAGGQSERAAFVAERRPRLVDGTGDGFGSALRGPIDRPLVEGGVARAAFACRLRRSRCAERAVLFTHRLPLGQDRPA